VRSWLHSKTLADAVESEAQRTDAVDVPRSFIAFCEWMGVKLTDGQTEFARVAYDCAEPSGGLSERLFGFTGSVQMGARSVVAAVCGARGGKSYIAVALRLVFGMLVRDLSSMAPGQRAVALIIAPNNMLRREVMNYARGAIRSKPELEAMVCEDGIEGFGLRRPDGHLVRFETGVATAGGYGARGRALTDFALDECAFFRDSSFKVNDEEIYRAGAARVLPGGQVIIASTPWAQAGLLYEIHKRNWGKPGDALVAHAPTLLFHDSPMTRSIVEREELRDPDNAKREFGAQFMTGGTTVFFEPSTIDVALVDEPFVISPLDYIAAGGDFGFRSDSSALLLTALHDGCLHVFDGTEERPGDTPLKPSLTVAAFASKIAGRCSALMADQHYREAISELLEQHSLSYIPAPATPADTYVRARMLLREGRVKIHPMPFRDRLVQQLREVHGKPTSGGGMSIVHPRWATGGHGDLAAAFVLSLWQLWGEQVPAPAIPDPQQARIDRFEHFKKQNERTRHQAKGGSVGFSQKHRIAR
jgi:hypothetical protein